MHGIKAVGSTGSPEKAVFVVKELGFDGAWNYRAEPIADALTRLAPPLQREPVTSSPEELTGHISTVASGIASQMNFPNEQKYRVKTLVNIIHKRFAMHGFVCSDKHLLDKYPPSFATDTLTWIAEGKIKAREEVVSGMDNTPASCTRQDTQGRWV
ncbi:putative Enoyl reductase (ER) domain-containing protein [Seiridium cardinale]|uniref:Enoyl reductase (ER) domain-containing protein n=1 Tax=Seiridium cardinale TaxID=138064 RepID=A0ABR2XHJ6_9PEZI